MMQQAYTTALWYLSCVTGMPVSHTDKNSSEAVPGNESGTTTASFSKSKHARSLETAKDCSATVSNNRANSVVTVELSASSLVIAQRSACASVSVITELFGNDRKHTSSSETAKDCSTTVSGINHASSLITANKISLETLSENESSGTTAAFSNHNKHASSSETAKDCSTTVSGKNHASSATKISAHSVNQAIKVRQANTSWKTTVYFVLVITLLTSFALEVQGHLCGITNEDCADAGANTEQWGDFRTGTAEKCTAFLVQLDETQHQRSVQLHR